jgi:hypothetical protein
MNENIENLRISLPEQKNYDYAYGLAFKLASDKLSHLDNLEEQCRKSGSTCELGGDRPSIDLNYLNREYRISLPDVNIGVLGNDDNVELRDKILILHYFLQAKGTPLSNNLITYKELQEGAAYYPSFFKRAIKPLMDYFGNMPDRIIPLSEELGGIKTDHGDASVIIPAFARVPVSLVLWKGDDEFPPNANILFDNTILDYLPVEDVNILCQTIVWRLVKALKSG